MGRSTDRTVLDAPARAPTPALLAQWAYEALVDEALLTPKPGLIDLRGQHAHGDMSLGLMCMSALTLRPWFEAMADNARLPQGLFAWRTTLGALGREAERAMLRATGGVNAHRGAIWALGLLIAATARSTHRQGAARPNAPAMGPMTTCSDINVHTLAHLAAQLARCPDRFAPAQMTNKGALACLRYRVNGARGQAQAGFPHVIRIGLPTLLRLRATGHNEQQARLDTLLTLIATLDDTCLLSRGGTTALAWMQTQARHVLHQGGSVTAAGRIALTELNSQARKQGLSPGGAADLLAATLFLDRIHHHFSSRPARQDSATRA